MMIVKMINRGMITIPAAIRKKYKFKEGMEFVIEDLGDGIIKLVPVIDINKEYSWYKSPDELKRILNEYENTEIGLENGDL